MAKIMNKNSFLRSDSEEIAASYSATFIFICVCSLTHFVGQNIIKYITEKVERVTFAAYIYQVHNLKVCLSPAN